MKPIIYYHDSCADGFGAAFAAWLKLGNDAEYVPVQYGQNYDDIPAQCKDRDVYILDFSFPKPIMDTIIGSAQNVVWLDHHKTAFEMWCETERERYEWRDTSADIDDIGRYILLDNNKSGALLAWEYFHPEKVMADLILNIDDRDRWQFKRALSKAQHEGLMANRPWKFEQWKGFTNLVHNNALGGLVQEGQILLKKQAADVEASVKHADECVVAVPFFYDEPHIAHFDGDGCCRVRGLAVNCASNISEVGHALAIQSGTYGLVWWYSQHEQAAVCSLRSNGDYDVSAIAKQFGGGGHKNAAGFKVPMAQLLEWL